MPENLARDYETPSARAPRDEQVVGEGLAKQVGFFTDTTLCIGCKACDVACKQWNQLPDDGFLFTGMSYDNTGHLGASTWRHVAFVERTQPLPGQGSPRDGVDGGPHPFAPLRPAGQPGTTSLLADYVAPSHIETPVEMGGPPQTAAPPYPPLAPGQPPPAAP